ncbi:MAG: helix-turn-helix domain-containing protein [Selenomonadaceae bacterium]|nr:helix-turn-helix domain-containing protein [Selenomonadaceae bacterium]
MFEVNPAKVKSLMFEKSLTIRGLAQKAGLTETTAAKAIRGSKSNAMTVGKLAAALGVRGEDILMEAN